MYENVPSLDAQVIQHPSLVGTILSQLFELSEHKIGSHCIMQLLSRYIHLEQFNVNAFNIGRHVASES